MPVTAPVLDQDLVDREALAHLGAGLRGGLDEQRVEHGAPRADAVRLPSTGRGEPEIVTGPKSNE